MPVVSCGVTEILVAVGDSYWRCVSCHLQFSKLASIDEHIRQKHDDYQHYGSQLGPISSTLAQPNISKGAKSFCDVPKSDNRSDNRVPAVVQVNLDIPGTRSRLEAIDRDGGKSAECGMVSHLGAHDVGCPDLLPQSHLGGMGLSPVKERSKPVGYTKSSTGDGGELIARTRSSIPEKCDVIEVDDDDNGNEEGGDTILTSMLSLLEKNLEAEDLPSMFQNFENLSPEQLEKQLLSPTTLSDANFDNNDDDLHSDSLQEIFAIVQQTQPYPTSDLLNNRSDHSGSVDKDTDHHVLRSSCESPEKIKVGHVENSSDGLQPPSTSILCQDNERSCDSIRAEDLSFGDMDLSESICEDSNESLYGDKNAGDLFSAVNNNSEAVAAVKSFMKYSSTQSKIFDLMSSFLLQEDSGNTGLGTDDAVHIQDTQNSLSPNSLTAGVFQVDPKELGKDIARQKKSLNISLSTPSEVTAPHNTVITLGEELISSTHVPPRCASNVFSTMSYSYSPNISSHTRSNLHLSPAPQQSTPNINVSDHSSLTSLTKSSPLKAICYVNMDSLDEGFNTVGVSKSTAEKLASQNATVRTSNVDRIQSVPNANNVSSMSIDLQPMCLGSHSNVSLKAKALCLQSGLSNVSNSMTLEDAATEPPLHNAVNKETYNCSNPSSISQLSVNIQQKAQLSRTEQQPHIRPIPSLNTQQKTSTFTTPLTMSSHTTSCIMSGSKESQTSTDSQQHTTCAQRKGGNISTLSFINTSTNSTTSFISSTVKSALESTIIKRAAYNETLRNVMSATEQTENRGESALTDATNNLKIQSHKTGTKDKLKRKIDLVSPIKSQAKSKNSLRKGVKALVSSQTRKRGISSKIKKKTSGAEVKGEHFCTICDLSFCTAANLNRHTRVNFTTGKPCKCKVCGKKFHGLGFLSVHLYDCHEKYGKPTCLICNATFSSRKYLMEHVRRHQKAEAKELAVEPDQGSKVNTKGKHWRCKWCHKIFHIKSSLRRNHTCSKIRTCIQCNETFPTFSLFRIHMATHEGRMFQCDVCGEYFKDKLSRKLHRQTHPVTQGSLCQICGKTFTKKDAWNRHMKIHFQDDNPANAVSYHCTDCNKVYKCKVSYKRHMDTTHNGIEGAPFKCSLCDKRFKRSTQLREHMSVCHYGEMPYKCQYCGHGFVCRQTLVRHESAKHTNRRPHQCRFCPQAFVEKKSLALHEARTHTHIYPHNCSICGKGFVTAATLRSHMKIHTKYKPHQCHMCGSQFFKPCHLKRHMEHCAKRTAEAELAESLRNALNTT